jgi:hypothetical protein
MLSSFGFLLQDMVKLMSKVRIRIPPKTLFMAAKPSLPMTYTNKDEKKPETSRRSKTKRAANKTTLLPSVTAAL